MGRKTVNQVPVSSGRGQSDWRSADTSGEEAGGQNASLKGELLQEWDPGEQQ